MFKFKVILVAIVLLVTNLESMHALFIAKASDPAFNLPVPFKCTTFLWGPQNFNISGPLTSLGLSTGCSELPGTMNLTGKVVLVPGFKGCSYETVARNVQKKKPALMVFMGKFGYEPGVEAFITDTSDTSDITTPMVSLAIFPYFGALLNMVAAMKGNATVYATVVPDTNSYKELFKTPLIILFQIAYGGFSAFCFALASYKLYLFHQAQKGFHMNISQITLGVESVTNFLRFIWCAVDPFHGPHNIYPWSFVKFLQTFHAALNFVSLIFIGFYWTDLVNNSTGSKSTFLSRTSTKIMAFLFVAVVLGIEIFATSLDSTYVGGHYWTLISACTFIVEWFFIGTWFLYCGWKLIRALSKGKGSKEAGVQKVTRRVTAIGLLLHANWINMIFLIFYGTATEWAYFGFWCNLVTLISLGSYLQIGVFNPPQWREKVDSLKGTASSVSTKASSRNATVVAEA